MLNQLTNHRITLYLTLIITLLSILLTPQLSLARADVAEPKNDSGWMSRHNEFVRIAQQNTAQVVFLGDSITAMWSSVGVDVFRAEFSKYNAANFGIGGDRTEHVLWRVRNGEFPTSFTPKVVVLMIGTNNLSESEQDIANGIRLIVGELKERAPNTKILLHGIFPKGDEGRWNKVKRVNDLVRVLDNPSNGIYYLDIGRAFAKADGTFNQDLFRDGGHLNADGYQVWADNIRAKLADLVGSGGGGGGGGGGYPPTISLRANPTTVTTGDSHLDQRQRYHLYWYRLFHG